MAISMFQKRSGQTMLRKPYPAHLVRVPRGLAILTRRLVSLRRSLLSLLPLEYCSNNRPWTGMLDISHGRNWYHEASKYASEMPRSLNAPVPSNAYIHRSLSARSYLITSRSSVVSIIGKRSPILFGSRNCAGTSLPLDASF